MTIICFIIPALSCGGIMRQLLSGILAVFAISNLASAQGGTQAALKPIFIHCGTLLDGKSEQPRKNVFFEIQGDKITAIPAAVPGSAKVIDLSNETCLP